MNAKYLRRNSVFQCKIRGDSYIWQRILSSRQSLLKGVCYKIGDCLSITHGPSLGFQGFKTIFGFLRRGLIQDFGTELLT